MNILTPKINQDKLCNQAEQIFTILREQNPYPNTELKYTTPFELLVAVVLSAQATDVGVNKATAALFKFANTPQQIELLGVSGLESYIKSIGLYKTKAKNIFNLAKELIARFDAEVPDNFTDLITLPGVGRKTANVILNTLYGHQSIAVDTHVFRVSNRLGLSCGKNPFEVETDLQEVIPQQFKVKAHHWLILHGRYICRARKPLCTMCNIKQYCYFYKSNNGD